MAIEYAVETEVLVIGGGMAGCFAAIKAKEQGVKVTLVDKSYVGRSGQTLFALHLGAPVGRNYLDRISINGEYLNNRLWTEIIAKDAQSRVQDAISWGAVFQKNEDEDGRRPGGPLLDPKKTSVALRKQAVTRGVKVMDRIMVTELLKQRGKVVGAVGIPLNNLGLYLFTANTVVLCTGAGGFKASGWPTGNLTADGQAMAYRAGAVIGGKEFNDCHETCADYPGQERLSNAPPTGHGMHPRCKVENADGMEITWQKEMFLDMEFEAHAGRAPIYAVLSDGSKSPWVGGAATGMGGHTTEGLWPVNTTCASNIPGLYGAGDSLCTMWFGAVGVCPGLIAAAVTGARAGLGAAEYALLAKKPVLDEKEVSRAKKIVLAPIERHGGFSPRWVTQILQNLMIPYYITYIKHGKRMEAALTIVEFLRDHIVPKLFAKDPHELRLAHETKNMVLNAEIVLKSSLFRTESRGPHYREDYPKRVDPDWLAWVQIKKENDAMRLFKKPIPQEWWPNLSKPYEERYPARYPKELK